MNYRNKTIENKLKSQIVCRLHRNTIINLQNKNLREFSHRLAQPTKHRQQKCIPYYDDLILGDDRIVKMAENHN